MKENNTLKVTSISDLEGYANGEIVRLPDFAEGQPFVARLRRPSMMSLVKNGKIPNALLRSANELFAGGVGAFDEENEQALDQMYHLIDIICEASFIEPRYSDIQASGVELTDEQYLFIFNYSQRGVKALESFREE